MHIETTGYISIDSINRGQIEYLISKHMLSEMDCHEDEILTDVEEGFLSELKGSIITEDEYNELMEKCSSVKFYW